MTKSKADDELVAATIALIENIIAWLGRSKEFVQANINNLGFDGIPASGQGILLSDQDAMRRFHLAFLKKLEETTYRLRVSPPDAYREFKQLISDRLLYGGEDANRKTVLRYFEKAASLCVAKIRPMKRYIACNICHDETPAEIDFGVVRFIPRKVALSVLESSLAKAPGHLESLENESGWGGVPQRRIDALKEHYTGFDWTAEVSISEFDFERGIEQSYRLAQCGLDFLHLLVGAPYSDRMRLDWNLLDNDRPASFAVSEDGLPITEVKYRSTSRHLGDGWWDEVRNNAGEDGVELFRLVIDRANDPINTHPLARRYVDALTWYGDAVREKVSVSRLLKFVMSIEFLVGTSDTTDIAKTLAKRGASILFMNRYDDLQNLEERFLKVYDTRSAIVHGSASPRDTLIDGVLVEAEFLSRSLLVEMLPILGKRGFEERAVSLKRIKRFYNSIAEKAAALSAASMPPRSAPQPKP